MFLCKTTNGYTLRNLIEVLMERGVIAERMTVKDLDINNKLFKRFYIEHKSEICRLQSHKNDAAKIFSKVFMIVFLFLIFVFAKLAIIFRLSKD